jgi:hypothetical protein
MCVVCSRGIEDGGRRKGIDDACNNAGPDELKKIAGDRSIDRSGVNKRFVSAAGRQTAGGA